MRHHGQMAAGRRWYAIHTKPRCEDQAIGWIQRRTDVPVFLPRLEVLRRRRRRAVPVIEPLFPSYVFAHMTLDPEDWYAVKWAPGVKGIVSVGETPVPVPDGVIDLLLERCAAGHIRWRPRWTPGTPVHITHGPFAGLIGILERPTARPERVRVLLRLMHTTVPVEVELVDVEAVGSAARV